MGEARDVLDRMTAAMITGDLDALEGLYAEDAVAITPEVGEVKGRDQIRQHIQQFLDAFPDAGYEPVAGHESGNVAIDEGFFTGTNNGDLVMPDGQTIPATGKRIHMRTCDVATIEHGKIVRHAFYHDQVEFMTQLGLMPDDMI